MTRSTPSISSSGNVRPAATMMRSLGSASAIMFLPISPSPPRGTIRNDLSVMVGGSEEAHLLGFRRLFSRALVSRLLQNSRQPAEVVLDGSAHVGGVQSGRWVIH